MKGGAFLAVFIAALTPFAIVVLLVFGSTQGFVAWKPPALWTSEFGDPNLDSGVAGIASGNDGVYVVGAFNYTTSVNYYATFAPFLRGYRADGSIAWADAIGNPRRFYPTGVTVGADGVYVVGSGSSNGTLIKYDLAGNRMWSDTVNASVVSAYGDGVYVVGVSSHGVTNQSFTGSVVFVREYRSNGGVVWTDEFSNSSYALGIYAGASGVFVLTSRSIVGYSLTGRELWIHQVGVGLLIVPLSISADATGVYFADTVGQCGICPHTAFLSKYDFGGSVVWNVTFEAPDRSEPLGALLATDSSGVYLSTSSGSSGYVEKYDQDGNSVWSMKTPLFPLGGAVSPNDFLIANGSGEFYLAGSIRASQGDVGLVQAFSASPSLVFFGVNPPLSFVLFGSLTGVAVLSVFLFWRRRVRMTSNRPKSTSPDRYRKPGDTLSNSNSFFPM